MNTISVMQEQQLCSLRPDAQQLIEDRLRGTFHILMFTYYPETDKFGISILTNEKRVYFGRGRTMVDMADDLLKAVQSGEFVLQQTIKHHLN